MDDDLLDVIIDDGNNNYNDFENDSLKTIIKSVFFSDTFIEEEPVHMKNYKKNPHTGKYDFCCLCGKFYFEHEYSRHNFINAFDEHRCIKCNKFFFHHKHSDNKSHSWIPFKYIE
jgi:hypothetical protein